MREIKFRAWNHVVSKMVYQPTLEEDGNTYMHFAYTKEGAFESCQLMQYTGLKDVNGKEIYEGDILAERDILADGGHPDKLFVAEFDDRGCFIAKEIGPPDFALLDDYDFVIVGNLYEHPELLEAKA